MNKNTLFAGITFAIVLLISSCGPAAEDRKAMHTRAKVFQDSIANLIQSSLNEAEMPTQMATPPNTAAPTATTQAK